MNKKIWVALFLAIAICGNIGFAQTHTGYHKKVKSTNDTQATPAPEKKMAKTRVNEAKAIKPEAAGKKLVAKKKPVAHHKAAVVAPKKVHHKVAAHHKAKSRVHATVKEVNVNVPASSQALIVIKNGTVLINNSPVLKIHSLKHEEDRINVNIQPTHIAADNQNMLESGARSSNDGEHKAFLGVLAGNYFGEGAMIEHVVPESPADEAGLHRGDVIKELGEKDIDGAEDLVSAVGQHAPGDKVNIDYMHYGRMLKTDATLTEKKAPAEESEEKEEKDEKAPEAKPCGTEPAGRQFYHGRWYW